MNEAINQRTLEEAVSCQWGVLASGYFDNELEPSEKERFREHLFFCPECALDLEAFRTIRRAIRSIEVGGREIQGALAEHMGCPASD